MLTALRQPLSWPRRMILCPDIVYHRDLLRSWMPGVNSGWFEHTDLVVVATVVSEGGFRRGGRGPDSQTVNLVVQEVLHAKPPRAARIRALRQLPFVAAAIKH